jgi:DNA polymerase-1
MDFDPGETDPLYFYRNFAKPMIPDMIQLMSQGLLVDPDAVDDLRKTIDEVLDTVRTRLDKSPLIAKYQNSRLPEAQRKHAEEATKSLRTIDYYIKPYKPGDMVHRTWLMNEHLRRLERGNDVKDKWTVKDMKQYNVFLKDPYVGALITKKIMRSNAYIEQGMRRLAQHKLELWNRPRLEKAETPVDVPLFNPNSTPQVKGFFEMMNIKPVAYSKDTGEASWGRDSLEQVYHETTDPELKVVLEAMIDFSFSAIIKNNFLKAFDSFTIDGVLHGNIKLFGAKSFRPTSNRPNLLNAPSSGSIYAKPLKRCFIAEDGCIIYAIDLSALEDRVLACLSGDTNKCNVFLEGLDGHSLNACGYFPDEIAKHMGPVGNYNSFNDYVKDFYHRVEELKDEALKGLRSRSKAPTFKLAYGGYPDAEKGGVITQELFDNYHQVLYPGVTDYRENYVLETCKRQGYIHLGLGCRMYSSDPGQAIRTLHNATIQFWSILTLIAINEMNHRVREVGLENEIRICSTIYDSIYSQVILDPEILAWANEQFVEVLTVPYLEEQIIPNEAAGEIGYNWADLTKVPNGATPQQIIEILEQLSE